MSTKPPGIAPSPDWMAHKQNYPKYEHASELAKPPDYLGVAVTSEVSPEKQGKGKFAASPMSQASKERSISEVQDVLHHIHHTHPEGIRSILNPNSVDQNVASAASLSAIKHDNKDVTEKYRRRIPDIAHHLHRVMHQQTEHPFGTPHPQHDEMKQALSTVMKRFDIMKNKGIKTKTHEQIFDNLQTRIKHVAGHRNRLGHLMAANEGGSHDDEIARIKSRIEHLERGSHEGEEELYHNHVAREKQLFRPLALKVLGLKEVDGKVHASQNSWGQVGDTESTYKKDIAEGRKNKDEEGENTLTDQMRSSSNVEAEAFKGASVTGEDIKKMVHHLVKDKKYRDLVVNVGENQELPIKKLNDTIKGLDIEGMGMADDINRLLRTHLGAKAYRDFLLKAKGHTAVETSEAPVAEEEVKTSQLPDHVVKQFRGMTHQILSMTRKGKGGQYTYATDWAPHIAGYFRRNNMPYSEDRIKKGIWAYNFLQNHPDLKGLNADDALKAIAYHAGREGSEVVKGVEDVNHFFAHAFLSTQPKRVMGGLAMPPEVLKMIENGPAMKEFSTMQPQRAERIKKRIAEFGGTEYSRDVSPKTSNTAVRPKDADALVKYIYFNAEPRKGESIPFVRLKGEIEKMVQSGSTVGDIYKMVSKHYRVRKDEIESLVSIQKALDWEHFPSGIITSDFS